jgi:hypothetical protein
MKIRTMIVLAVSLVVLAIFYRLDYSRMIDRETVGPTSRSPLLSIKPEAIDTIEVRNSMGTVTFVKRSDGQWWITRPFVDMAEPGAVERDLLEPLKKAKRWNGFDSATPDKPGEKTMSGFENALTIIMRSASAGCVFAYELGAETPIKGDCYVRDMAHPTKIQVTSIDTRTAFEADFRDLRDRNLLPYGRYSLDRIDIERRSGEAFQIVSKGGREWEIETRDEATSTTMRNPADNETVGALLTALRTGRVGRFLRYADESTSETVTKALSENKPLVRTSLISEGQTKLSISIFDTTTTGTKNSLGYLATCDSVSTGAVHLSRAVFTVDTDLFNALNLKVEDYRDRAVVHLPAEDTDYLQVEILQSVVSLARDKDKKWAFSTGVNEQVSQSRAEGYVLLCSKLRVDHFVPPTDNSQTNLDAPMLRITVANKDRSVRDGFEVGASLPGDSARFYARRVGTDAIYVIQIPGPVLQALLKTRDQFVGHKLLEFDAKQVARIEFEMHRLPKNSLVLTKTGDKDESWTSKLDEDAEKSISGKYPQVLMLVLDALEYIEPLAQLDSKALTDRKLDPPAMIIRLYDAKGKVLAELAFGEAKESGGKTVRVGAKKYFFMESSHFVGLGQAVDVILKQVL